MRYDQPEGLSIPHNSRMCLVTTLRASSFREQIIVLGPWTLDLGRQHFSFFRCVGFSLYPGPRFRFQGFETWTYFWKISLAEQYWKFLPVFVCLLLPSFSSNDLSIRAQFKFQ